MNESLFIVIIIHSLRAWSELSNSNTDQITGGEEHII